jgi:gamma-glutamylcyclotransferase (GGCT)/AIG2-like uncharacterized protein YtfP
MNARNSGESDVWLFAYGTLRQKDVQLALFGRALEGHADVLPGFLLSPLLITDPAVIATSGTAHHTVIRRTGNPQDRISGMAFNITGSELAAADEYEVADVKRVSVRLESGIEAFVYVSALTQ